ncbi:diacylglycerol acyltransferase, putative [Eimeria tenella]|uniref:diacylglycerol O-acyltransferase n=1 Tax=Eimeria tenella TaxID=5802 RepID=U6KS05_EIMTE|nr:diacylglycerol acyltransferase, putative [Eimeria tenella]CDJ39703.1 diacylglycerol acyltransferase, putative [Eimeria tenella]|eukprot:XP_013230456.1 diacylglycerol acyltransferase, putative [Eimeria tenella]
MSWLAAATKGQAVGAEEQHRRHGKGGAATAAAAGAAAAAATAAAAAELTTASVVAEAASEAPDEESRALTATAADNAAAAAADTASAAAEAAAVETEAAAAAAANLTPFSRASCGSSGSLSSSSACPSVLSPAAAVAAAGSFSPAAAAAAAAAAGRDGTASPAAAAEEAAAAAKAAAAARTVWMAHSSSAVRLEQLQELKEEVLVNRKKRLLRRQQQQQQQQQVAEASMQQQAKQKQTLQQRRTQQQQQQQQQRSAGGLQLSYAATPGKAVDYRGRPLHDVEHASFKSSLLSHHSKTLNLRGFFNLFFIVLVVVNASLVAENILTYGCLLQFPRSLEDLSKNWPVLCCFLLLHLCIVGAYVIERFVAAASLEVFDGFVAALVLLNLSICFFMPFLTVLNYQPEPVVGSLLLAFSIVWCFKLFSMHHTCLDTRRAMLRGEDFLALCSDREEEARAAARYPHSITLAHVYRFIVLPTMCFQVGIVIDQYIWVVVRDSFSITELQSIPLSVLVSHFFRQMVRLSIPNLYVWLLMFIGLFHHWCNILAEITRFGDREFYLDWWNASSFGEYWRKWNLPIHFFLHRHVNKPLLRNGVPKFFAACVVFFISALMHEYLVVVPLQLGWTGFIFFAFIGQIPLMYFTNIQFFQDNPTVGNCFFWLVFCFTGQPLGILLYWYLWGVKQGAVTELDPSRIALS